MARPKKQVVDYFPHYCHESRTLKIAQTKFGNDAFAFWFKMLQLLGKTEGHHYDYNNIDDWLFLLSETNTPDEQKALDILELFATLGMIDKELWEKKIIWIQHFVDNVSDAYKRRMVDKPQRPSSQPEPQPLPQTAPAIENPKVAAMIEAYEQSRGRPATPNDLEKLNDFAEQYEQSWFERAMKEHSTKNLSYIEKVLESWKLDGGPDAESKTSRKGRATIPSPGSYSESENEEV